MSDLQRYFADKWVCEGAEEKLFVHDLTAFSTVFDVGGHTGEWASEIFKRYYPKIHIFEPLPQYVKTLESKFPSGKVTVHPFALGSHEGHLPIYSNGSGSSFYITNANPEPVRVRPIAKVALEIFQVPAVSELEIDLIALNVEGAEYELLNQMLGSQLAYRCKSILVQFHPIWPSSYDERERLRNRLAETHYEAWSYPFVWELWRRRP